MFFLQALIFDKLATLCLGGCFLIKSGWGPLHYLYLHVHISYKTWEGFVCYFTKYALKSDMILKLFLTTH